MLVLAVHNPGLGRGLPPSPRTKPRLTPVDSCERIFTKPVGLTEWWGGLGADHTLLFEEAHVVSTMLSHFQVLSKIGEGGMGEVYRLP